MTYKNAFGKIYKVKWPFTSLDESKLRPALAISDPNNFGDEIMVQKAEFKAMGGKFIVPVPEVKIV